MKSKDTRETMWNQEYEDSQALPSSKTEFPSRVLTLFLSEHRLTNKKLALDAGCGTARNSIHLIKEAGFEKVVGLELSGVAVAKAQEKVSQLGLENQIEIYHQSLGESINLPDNSCDLVIDMMVMHAMTLEDREKYLAEVKRVLKDGGYFVFHTLSANGAEFEVLVKENPGSEPNSYIFNNGNFDVTEKAFTQDELEQILMPLQVQKLEQQESITQYDGKDYVRYYWYGVFIKK